MCEVARGDRDGAHADRDRRQGRERPVAIAHEHDDVIGGAARAGDGDGQVGETVAGEIARHDRIGRTGDRQADHRRRLERPVAVAQGDRDGIGARQGDGHVEVVVAVAVEVADHDRGRAQSGISECAGRGGGLKRPIAGPQVDPVWGDDVEDAVVGEVADGDRRKTAPLEVGRQYKGLKRVGRRGH